MSKVIQFPQHQQDGLTIDQWHEELLALHGRLSEALTKDRKQIDLIRVVLSIDDVADLMQVIEDKLGPDCFSDD